MFVRASKRSSPQDAYRQSIATLESLQLPFLCPALFGSSNYKRTTSTVTRVSSSRRSEQSRASTVQQKACGEPHRRSLASAAAAAVDYAPDYDTYIPWDKPRTEPYNYQPSFTEPSIGVHPIFSPSSPPIIIKDSLSTHPKKFRASKDAISGDTNEIHQTLHACLQVGRLERAAALVRRLNQIYKANEEGLLTAHNEYVGELTHRIVKNKDQPLLQHLQRWFQADLRDVGVEPDAVTYSMMIRASLQASDARKDRTVRGYVNLAREAGKIEETERLLSMYEELDRVWTLLCVIQWKPVTNFLQGTAPFFRQPQERTFDKDPETEHTTLEPTFVQPTEKVDEVREMRQKGVGLSTLKQSLSIFSNAALAPEEDHKNITPAERQTLLENNTINAAMDRWHQEDKHLKSIGVNSGLSTSSIGAMMWRWHEKFVPLIKDDIRKSQEAEKKENRSKSDEEYLLWGPYLQSLPPEKMSAITILSAMKTCSTDVSDERGVRIHNLVQGIGDGVQNESIAEAIRKNKKDKNWRSLTSIANARSRYDSLAKLVRSSSSRAYDKLEWDASMRVKVGANLLSHLMDIAKVQVSRKDPKTGLQVREYRPVFFHTFQYVQGKRVGVVRLNSDVLDKLSRVPVLSAIAKYLPMVCEPKPWAGYSEGGFLEHPLPVIRLHSGDTQSRRYAITAAENGDMDQVFAGLDVLARTPWKINRFVFDTMLEAWNSGDAIASIPPESPPTDSSPEPPPSDDPTTRSRWMRHMREVENHRSGLKSQRCFQNFQLEVARAYLHETFYFPHNCDFRGRAYPMAPFLNHMGADNARGLLVFAHGKELSSEGLWWLKVHLANVYGYDKASFQERVEFTETHLSEVRDSVNAPFEGGRWWLKAEDPWQCLAACNELKNALDSPDPTKYVCQLAIHQDGTCNGLQHYAALGGDVAGAQQVNLVPGQRPSDIYTAVAEIVKAEIAKDAAQGNELAKALEGIVTRKVVKQTVMTNVYGVTFTGAKRQVRKQLDDLLTTFPNTTNVSLVAAAPYIAKKIFAALATMFNGAHDIQYWLTACAARISESLAPEQVAFIDKASRGEQSPSPYKKTHLKGTPKDEITDFKTTVIWTTPLKMPVVQPYRKKTARRIETNLQKITIMNRSAADPVNKAKQLQAFPPNFIHSLDATHMFLTALKCNEVGLTFAAIHDSFWTHAGDVHKMNTIIRDAFIRMHSEDIIGRLAAEFKARYKDYMHLASVRRDTPIGQKILAWRRERSKESGVTGERQTSVKNLEARKFDELLLERRRLDLLASEDPKEREEGEQMNTPGKIFSEAADEKALAPLEAKPATIGLTPTSRSPKLKANIRLDVGDMENTEPVEPATSHETAGVLGSDPEVSENGEVEALTSADDGEELEDEVAEEEVGNKQPEVEKKAKREYVKKTWAWLPLIFPPVPKKVSLDRTILPLSRRLTMWFRATSTSRG